MDNNEVKQASALCNKKIMDAINEFQKTTKIHVDSVTLVQKDIYTPLTGSRKITVKTELNFSL